MTMRQCLLVVLLCCSALLGACTDEFAGVCNPLTRSTATVLLQGQAALPLPAPVTLNGVPIGKVIKADLNSENRPVLTLCLDKEQAAKLDKATVFYIAQDQQGGGMLVCQPFPEEQAPPAGDLVFLGFDSYATFVSWRAQSIVRKGVDGFLKALDEAVNKAVQ